MFAQLLANGLVTGSVIAIAAVGVSIVYAILRLVNFAYGDLMAFGALAAYAFNGPLRLGLVVSAVLAMIATAGLSLAPGARSPAEPAARLRPATADLSRGSVQGLRPRQRSPLASAGDHDPDRCDSD